MTGTCDECPESEVSATETIEADMIISPTFPGVALDHDRGYIV